MSKLAAIALLVFGIILALLGGLWFLQGTEIIQLQPIFCVAECEPVTDGSALWTVVGAVTFLVGIVTIGASARRIRRASQTAAAKSRSRA